jgi:hypothetical protein
MNVFDDKSLKKISTGTDQDKLFQTIHSPPNILQGVHDKSYI